MFDAFMRADSATSLGTADSGETWQTQGTWGISNNMAYCPAGNGTCWIMGSVPAMVVEADIIWASSASDVIVTRLVDANNSLQVVLSNTIFYLYKRSGGSYVSLGSTAVSHTPGVTYHIKAEVTAAGVFNGYQDGNLKRSYQLAGADFTKYMGSNACGVGYRSSSGAVRYDNLISRANPQSYRPSIVASQAAQRASRW